MTWGAIWITVSVVLLLAVCALAAILDLCRAAATKAHDDSLEEPWYKAGRGNGELK